MICGWCKANVNLHECKRCRGRFCLNCVQRIIYMDPDGTRFTKYKCRECCHNKHDGSDSNGEVYQENEAEESGGEENEAEESGGEENEAEESGGEENEAEESGGEENEAVESGGEENEAEESGGEENEAEESGGEENEAEESGAEEVSDSDS